jgi:hypothetical protein
MNWHCGISHCGNETLDMRHVIVWDIETVPDLKGFAAANGHDGKSESRIGTSITGALRRLVRRMSLSDLRRI